MNHNSQLTRLESTLKSYMDFMPYCPRSHVLKLSSEIVRISEKIEIINRMTLLEFNRQVDEYFDTKPCKLN